MLLAFAALLAVAESPLQPYAVGGLVSSATFGALAWYVIQRLWKERDEERAAWARERERERADTEKLLAAVIAATLATDRQTTLMERVEALLR